MGNAYVSYGRRPEGLVLQSQFGAVPLTGLIQIRIYDERPRRGGEGQENRWTCTSRMVMVE